MRIAIASALLAIAVAGCGSKAAGGSTSGGNAGSSSGGASGTSSGSGSGGTGGTGSSGGSVPWPPCTPSDGGYFYNPHVCCGYDGGPLDNTNGLCWSGLLCGPYGCCTRDDESGRRCGTDNSVCCSGYCAPDGICRAAPKGSPCIAAGMADPFSTDGGALSFCDSGICLDGLCQ